MLPPDDQPSRRALNAPRAYAPLLRGGMALVLAVLFSAVGYLFLSYRLIASPEIVATEVYNYLVSAALADGATVPDPRLPAAAAFRVAPLFALLGAFRLSLLTEPPADTFLALDSLRQLSGAFVALSGSLLLLLGWRVRGWIAGCAATLIFISNPLVVEAARRNLSASLATALVLLICLILTKQEFGLTKRTGVSIGILCGVTLLVNEGLVVIVTLTLVYALLSARQGQRRIWRGPFACGVLGLLVYAVYPLWAVWQGQWSAYLAGLPTRLGMGGGNVSQISSPRFVGAGIVLGLGLVITVGILARGREVAGYRLIAALNVVTVPGLALALLIGDSSVQPWLLPLAAAALAIGAASAALMMMARDAVRWREASAVAAYLALIAAIVLFQLFDYTGTVVASNAAQLRQVYAYLRATVPPDTALLLDDEAARSAFTGYRGVSGPQTPEFMRAHGLHYALIAGPMDRVAGADTADRIIASAVARYVMPGTPNSPPLGLYYLAYADAGASSGGTLVPTALSALQVAARPIPPLTDTAAQRYFSQTGHSVSGAFKRFWESRGVTIFGYPLTEPFVETGRTVQYFERVRLDVFPEFANTEREVQVAPLGTALAAAHVGQEAFAPVDAGHTPADGRYFSGTRHTLREPFRSFWERNGAESIFGEPLSEPVTERFPDGQTYLVQYFVYARLEYHPAQGGAPAAVVLSPLGRQGMLDRGWRP